MYIAFDFQIENTHDGFVVSAFVCDTPNTNREWKPLRNFGDRQSDAILFKEEDCPRLNEFNLKNLINRYDKDDKWMRASGRRFVQQLKAKNKIK